MTFSALRRMEKSAAAIQADQAARERGRLFAYAALRRGQDARKKRLARVPAGA
jgi:hypothetical protein